MTPPDERPAGVPSPGPGREHSWERLIGWFMGNKLVVFVLTALLIAGGVHVAPFAWQGGGLPRNPIPVDAIPDVGDNQQIVFTKWSGRSPRDVEDQITYPLTAALLGIPGVRTVRSASAFGFSTIYVIFEDDVEFYWSRSRVLEKLASLPPRAVPDGVTPQLGPDATALGQVFWYTLEGQDAQGNVVGGWDPDELRSIQDWTIRYALQAVPGVSEVASVGGFVREYQVDVDPEAMRAHAVTLAQVADAVRNSNLDVGARTLEINRVEYVVRGLGFVQGVEDLESTVVAAREHTPIRVRDVARVALGPALRRGALDDEGAPAVGGVVVARFMENPLSVISAVKQKIARIAPGLPRRTLDDGTVSQVKVVPFYDRTELIHETIATLSTALYEQILIAIIVVLVMLRNLRSSVLISAMLPLGVLTAFVAMKLSGVDANVMALAGIAIAIGTMVDIAIVFVENMNQHLDRASPDADRRTIVRAAAVEVAPAVLTSVLTTVVSFLPVFGLSSTELRLFAPLAFAKTFAMGAALLVALLVLPGAALWVLRRRPEPAFSEFEEAGRLTHLRASLLRSEHLRDFVLMAAGMALVFYSLVGGLIVIALGAYRLARPLLSPSLNSRAIQAENIVAVLAVTFLLAKDWLPLGHAAGLLANALFVAALVALVMGTFRLFELCYPFLLRAVLRRKLAFLSLPVAVVLLGASVWLGFDRVFGFLPGGLAASGPVRALAGAFPGLGREYMPPFDEGSFLYMPSTMPHASIGEALDLLASVDAAIATIPEVERAVGKIGRADTPLDPAPVSMLETVVTYKPEYRETDGGRRVRQWRDHIRTPRDIWQEIANATERPGLTRAPMLMPIQARLVMLQSGLRAPLGIKVHGPDLETIEAFGRKLEGILKQLPSIRPETVFADRVVAKPYLEIVLDREAIGRYGLSIADVQHVLQVALGGMPLTQTVEGRERYAIRVRYMREERDSIEALSRIYVPASGGEQIPLSQLSDIRYVRGPQVIRSEDTFPTSYVLFDTTHDVAEVEVVERARAAIEGRIRDGKLAVPAGVSYDFAGTYHNQVRSERRLLMLVPVALAVVFVLLYLQFHSVATSVIVYSGVAVAVAGGFGLLSLYGQPWFLNFTVLGVPMRDLFRVDTVNMSVAVWVGFIALIGIATDSGVVMSTYLKQCFDREPARTLQDVRERTMEAVLRRIRPCLMTTATTILALLPVVTSHGRGADVMMPMALPSIGGMAVQLLALFVVPVLYCGFEELKLRRGARGAVGGTVATSDEVR